MRNRFHSYRNLWCGRAFRNSCSLRTFQRSAFRLGFKSHPPITNILLTKEHRRKRREWAQKHQNVDWSCVIFSDESRFIINYHDSRIKVHRLKHERFLKSCMLEFNKGRQPSVMVLGVISRRNKSRLLRINGNLNSERYINEVLDVEALPLFYEQPNQIFQQDNARCHV